MDLMKPFKLLRKKVNKRMGSKGSTKDDDQLTKWKKKFEQAKNQTNPDMFDDREAQFLGTRYVDRNVNSGQHPRKGANNIYNISFEFVEAQVNSQIPQPNVRSKRKGYEAQAASIEQSIVNDLKEMNIEEINDYNERMTPLHGYSVMLLDWDPDFKHHLYRGELKVSTKHPKQIIPQPGVYSIQKMDYWFVVSGVTKEYINRRYGVDVEEDEQQYPEYNTLLGNANIAQAPSPKGLTPLGTNTNATGDLVTEIVCFYRDGDGDIGKFVWVDNTVCENLPKFYHRRMLECEECEHMNPMGTEECANCGSKKLKEVTSETQVLDQDVQLSNGEVLPMGTEIPYYSPTRYPVVIRKNVPRSFDFAGQSDVDVIRDQQDSIKKIGTKMEEKVIKSGSILLVPEDLTVGITSDTYQVVKGNAQQLQLIQTRDLKAPINEDMQYIEQQRTVAQQMLGITNSFQGLQDISAQSGRAKQVQVQQAAGRLQSKVANKVAAYKELFELMFDFKLAFYDELRPYISKDANGAVQYGEFDKYSFLVRDAAGELYYNTDFVFSADSGDGLPKDPMFMYEQANIQLNQGIINKVQYWTILESLNYPNAASFKDQAQAEMEAAANQPPPPTDGELKVQAQQQLQQDRQNFEIQKQQNDQAFEMAKIDRQHQQDLQDKLIDARLGVQKDVLQALYSGGGGNGG